MRLDNINIKTENNQFNFDLAKDEKFKEIEMFGNIDTITEENKINAIKSLFKKGTIKGSAIKDELYIIDEKYGFYSNGWEFQFCEYKQETEEIGGWYGKEETIVYDTTHLKKLEFNDIYDLLDEETKKKADELLQEYLKKHYENELNNIYYEFEAKTKYDDMRFYLEYKGTCFEIRISKNGYTEIFADGLEIYADKYNEISDKFEQIKSEEILKYIDKNITKLENGFVYKNKYYEDFYEIKEVIEEEMKEERKDD